MDWGPVPWELPAGILFLGLGGDMLVRGAVQLAQRLNVSRLLIGVTLVGFGTSMPELITSVHAALLNSPGIAVGNVVGSNTSNLLLVLGVSALIYPLTTLREGLRRNGLMLVAATLVCVLVAISGYLDRWTGVLLVALLLAYFIYCYVQERRSASLRIVEEADEYGERLMRVWSALILVVIGIAFVITGAGWLVDGSIELARVYKISETIIGLTVVAIGTSLPELITSIMAAFRKETAIALGNVLGSNIQNILGILGLTATIRPIPVPHEIIRLDIWVMAGATLALFILAACSRELGRAQGLLLLVAFSGYVSYLTYLAVV
jgi:cation:H+ antiporter